jgi:hypothetical protein
MAAMVLNSQRAMEISVYVVRAFVKLRETLSSNKELAAKLVELEQKLDTHDQAIAGNSQSHPPADEPALRQAPRNRIRG